MIAVAYLKLKQPEKAKQMLDLAKKHSPGNVEIFQAAANYYREEHDYKAAIATLKSAPHMTASILADLGYTYELDGDKEQAAQAYVRAANEKPKEIGYQLSAAQAELRMGDTEKTRQYLNRAAAIDANHYRLHAIKALLAKEESRQADAIAEYKAAIAAIPPGGVPEGQLYPIQLRLNLAELYRDSGDDQAAHQQLATAEQEIDKLDVEGTAKAEFLRVRASIKTSDNDLKGAEADLLEARKLDPDNDNITLQYANLLWKEGRTRTLAKFTTTCWRRILKTAMHSRPWDISTAKRTIPRWPPNTSIASRRIIRTITFRISRWAICTRRPNNSSWLTTIISRPISSRLRTH